MDFLTPAQRSVRMAAIPGRGNKTTEAALSSLFRRSGIKGWRRHLPLPGRPDFAFLSLKFAIFIDGCFWHGCPLHYRLPSSNTDFWRSKVESNRARDLKANLALRRMGWRVLRLWEHDLRTPDKLLRRVQKALDKRRVSGFPTESASDRLANTPIPKRGRKSQLESHSPSTF
jgi:DNA mismatch endonuclease (patch repair protein)